MNRLIKNPERFAIWSKGLALADTLQKMTDALSLPESIGLSRILRNMTFVIPSTIADGLTVHDFKDRRNYFYRTLNCLEELMSNLILTEQLGYLKKVHTRKIKKEIIELNRMICELINPHRLMMNEGSPAQG